MNKDVFQQLCASIEEAGSIKRGEEKSSRRTRIDEDCPRAIRNKLGLSQNEFAELLGIGVGTLRNWEQGRRHPTGAARVLIRVAAKHPKAILDAVA